MDEREMNAIGFFIAALGLFVLAAILISNTDPHKTTGGSDYEKRMQRRLIGNLLIVAGMFLFGLALLTQFFSVNAPTANPTPISSTEQPRTAPATSAPRPPPHQPGKPSQFEAESITPLMRETLQLLDQKYLNN